MRRVAWFGGVFGLSILDDVVLAAAACLYVRHVACILDDVVHAAAAYLYVRRVA